MPDMLLSVFIVFFEGEVAMERYWDADPAAGFKRRLGKSAAELGETGGTTTCPDIFELDNGDIAVIGRDLTAAYAGRLPADASIGDNEKIVVIPRRMLIAAKSDIPDA
jgi:hypothetical protein